MNGKLICIPILPRLSTNFNDNYQTSLNMTEEDFKKAVENMLMLQQNNDHNAALLQAQIDDLRRQLEELNNLKEMFRLPKPQNKDRKLFDETD